jgi:hypothetical protein
LRGKRAAAWRPRIKDAYGRFLVSADPSDDQVNQAWGIPVFADIWCPLGKGLLLDTTKIRLCRGPRIARRQGWLRRNRLHPKHFAVRRRGALGAVRDPAVGRLRDHQHPMTAVTVNAPYQVVHDETVHGPGQTVDVPQDVADKWLEAGWVSEAKATKAAPTKRR